MHEETGVELLATCWTSAGNASPLNESEVSPVSLFDRIRAVSAAGFRGIGLLHADLDAAQGPRGAAVMRDIAVALADHGIRHVELEFLTDWYAEGDRRRRSDRKRAQLLDWAALLGAHHIKAGSDVRQADGPASTGTSLAQITDAYGQLCADAYAAGTKVALEPQPYTEVATLAAGLQIVNDVGHLAGGLLIDVWHSTRGNWDLAPLLAANRAWLTAVELDDADAAVAGTLIEDTVNHRKLCGEGVFDIPAFIRAMRQAGFKGFWGVEILSYEYRHYPVEAGLRMAYETTMRQFEKSA